MEEINKVLRRVKLEAPAVARDSQSTTSRSKSWSPAIPISWNTSAPHPSALPLGKFAAIMDKPASSSSVDSEHTQNLWEATLQCPLLDFFSSPKLSLDRLSSPGPGEPVPIADTATPRIQPPSPPLLSPEATAKPSNKRKLASPDIFQLAKQQCQSIQEQFGFEARLSKPAIMQGTFGACMTRKATAKYLGVQAAGVVHAALANEPMSSGHLAQHARVKTAISEGLQVRRQD